MSIRWYVGIDPGKSGAIAVISAAGCVRSVLTLKDASNREIIDFLGESLTTNQAAAALERVHAMPRQGVSSTFKFGVSFGALSMALDALGIRYDLVSPQMWQSRLGCRSKGDKNVTKHAAQRRFPDVRVTHAVADALLLAEYARLYGSWAGTRDAQ